MNIFRWQHFLSFLLLLLLFMAAGCSNRTRLPSAVYKGKKSVGKKALQGSSKGREILTDASGAGSVSGGAGNLLANYAQLMGVHQQQLKRPELYVLIDEWMGVPYAEGGSSKKGIDCSGFATVVMESVYGKSIPRISGQQAEMVKRKYENQLQEGDLVFFSFGKRTIDHVGIYLANNKFVHASTSKGIIISDLKDSWYYRYFVRCGTVQ